MPECWKLSSECTRDKNYRTVMQGIRSQSTFVCPQLCRVAAMKLCPLRTDLNVSVHKMVTLLPISKAL